jgi:D-alanyl-D-alanine dipeptidase
VLVSLTGLLSEQAQACTVHGVSQPYSTYRYHSLLADPDRLGVPVEFVVPPLPELVEPSVMATVPVPASRDDEAMVQVAHSRIEVLSPYRHAGFVNAASDAFVRSGVLERLVAAAVSLPEGFGLVVLDAWRPLALQAEMFESAYADSSLSAGFVSAPSADPSTPPPHLTGGTVDVSLTWQGHPLALGSGFDEFTERARTAVFELSPGRVRELRRLLYLVMRTQGFVVLDCEWWHFELGTRRWAAITGTFPWYGAAAVVLHESSFTTP